MKREQEHKSVVSMPTSPSSAMLLQKSEKQHRMNLMSKLAVNSLWAPKV